ncbi:hypothetical protein KRX11_02350 [Pasteurellaceae bacterium TAE3-ERU1]|nr:hypothetical protein [Pasteurellaceae bacterium TAE3-ERU1]
MMKSSVIISLLSFFVGFLLCSHVIIFKHAEDFTINYGNVADWVVAIGTAVLAVYSYKAAQYAKKIWINDNIDKLQQKIISEVEHLDVLQLKERAERCFVKYTFLNLKHNITKKDEEDICLVRTILYEINELGHRTDNIKNYLMALEILLKKLDPLLEDKEIICRIKKWISIINHIEVDMEYPLLEISRFFYYDPHIDKEFFRPVKNYGFEYLRSALKVISNFEKTYQEFKKNIYISSYRSIK